jgi:hypothetical protein
VNRPTFNTLLRELQQEETEANRTKGVEYAGESDALANFKEGAEAISRADALDVCFVYFYKHYTAVRSFVENRETRSETLQSRIKDLRLYAALLYALALETEGETNA